MPLRISLLLSLLTLCAAARAIDVHSPEVGQFIDAMVSDHSYDRETLVAVLQQAEVQQSILEAIARPAERTLEWHEYRNIFLKPERIEAGAAFWRDNAGELQRISDHTGVSIEMLVGIIGVETYFGRITGNYRVLDALATLAFAYPPRSRFFRSELEQFLLLVREEGMDATAATGSYAGAMGRPQFMPSSYRAYAVDSTDDGKRDIWTNWSDVIGSVANYFVRHGWKNGGEVVSRANLGSEWQGDPPKNILRAEATVATLRDKGVQFASALDGGEPAQLLTLEGAEGTEYWVGFHNFFVITRYNRSVMYALAVHQLGQEIAREVNRGET